MNKILFKSLLLTLVATLWGSSAWAETYYSEQFSAESQVTGWSSSTGGRFTPVILDEEGNYFLSVDQAQRSNNGCVVTGTVLEGLVDAGADFTLTFDMRLSNSNNQTPVTVEFKDKANSGIVFSLTATAVKVDTWSINGTSTQVTLPNSGEGKGVSDITWCTYKISRSGTLTYLTITNKSTGEDILARSLISGSSEAGGLGNIVFTTRRYNANFAIDNIVVRDLEDGDVPSAAATTYTVECKDATGAEIASYTIPTIAGIDVDGSEYAKDFTKDGQKYIYVSGNKTITTEESAASNVITLLFRTAEDWTYTAKATDGQQDIKTLATGEVKEGDAASFIYPYYLNIDGKLYNKLETNKSFLYTFTPQSNNATENLTYDATKIENVVFFSEAEDIETLNAVTSTYLPERFSAGRGAYALDEAKKIVTLPAGVYKLTAQIMGTASECTFTFKAGEQTIWENVTSSQSFYVGAGISGEEFTLTQETDIMLQPGGGDGSNSRVTNSVDFIYIQKTGEYVPPIVYHTLTFGVTPDDAGTVTSEQLNDEGKYEEGTQIALTATANEGYKFKQWINGDVATNVEVLSTENPYTVTMNSDLNVVAQFVKTYTLTVDCDETKGSVTIDPEAEGGVYEENSVVDLHAIASLNSNCQFAGWVEVNGDGSETPINASAEYQVTMNRDIHLKALFEVITYQLTLTYDQAQGTAEVAPANATNTYETGTELTLTATPAEGYEFVNWTRVNQTAEEVLSDQNPYAFAISSDIAVKANFKAVEPVEPIEDGVVFFADVKSIVPVALAPGETEINTDMADITGGTMSAINQQAEDKNLINKQGSDYYFCLTNNNTFFKVVLKQALQVGDVITANTYSRPDTSLGLFVSTAGSRPGECATKLSIDATETGAPAAFSSYTIKEGDDLVGATTIYIYRETGKSTYFDEFKITRGGEPEEIVPGDANLNGEVTVSDAVLATSFVLQTVQPTEQQLKAADMDKSETIDVSDVMAIVNIILPDDEPQAGVRSAEAVDNFITLSGTDISLSNTNAFAAFQMDVTLDDGAQLNDVRMASRASKLNLAYNRIDDNTYRVVGVAYDKQVIDGHNGQLLTLDVTGNSQVAVDNVIFVDTKAKAYAVGMGHTTGISRVSTVAEGTDVYTVGGVKTTKLTKGLNVIRSANGEVRKVYVK